MLNEISKLKNEIDKAVDFEKKLALFTSLFDKLQESGNYDELKVCSSNLIEIAKKNNSVQAEIIGLINNGIGHFYLEENEDALKSYFSAVEAATEISDKKSLVNLYNNIAGVFFKSKDLDSTIEYSHKALNLLSEQRKFKSIIPIYMNLSKVYQIKNDLKEASKYLELAQKENEKIDSKPFTWQLKVDSATLEKLNKNYSNAISHIDDSIAHFHRVGNDYLWLRAKMIKTSILNHMAKYQEAINITNEVLFLCKEKSYDDLTVAFLTEIVSSYKNLSEYKKAFEYQIDLTFVQQNLFEKRYSQRISGLQTNFKLFIHEKEKEVYKLKYIDLEKALKDLKQTSNELELLIEENKSLLHVLSHDLNNPIQALFTLTEIIKFKYSNEDNELLDYTNKVTMIAKNMSNLIGNVKEMLSIEAGKANIKLEPTPLNVVINQIQTIFSTKLQKKNIDLLINYSKSDKDYSVFVEPISFQNSVMCNLLSNAIKFSYPNSTISINVTDNEKFCNIEISDSGTGIDPQVLKNIFSTKKPTTSVGTNGERGTGFGMPIVKKYIDKYEGKISITSKTEKLHPNNHGTTVTIQLLLA